MRATAGAGCPRGDARAARAYGGASAAAGKAPDIGVRALPPEVARTPLCDDGCAGQPTVAALRQAAASARVLHLASHAESYASAWARQLGLAVAGIGVAGDLGGWRALGAQALETWRLDAALVVLSACSSRVAEGDGVEGGMGLSRALLVAGARAVLATRWPVDDDSPRRFFASFYLHARGQDARTATWRAKAELREGRWGHPLFWAGYALTGDPAGHPVLPGRDR